MPDDRESRIKSLESALDPNVTKFAPKIHAAVPMMTLITQVREQAQATLKLCDEMEEIIKASEGDARKVADLMIAWSARIK